MIGHYLNLSCLKDKGKINHGDLALHMVKCNFDVRNSSKVSYNEIESINTYLNLVLVFFFLQFYFIYLLIKILYSASVSVK